MFFPGLLFLCNTWPQHKNADDLSAFFLMKMPPKLVTSLYRRQLLPGINDRIRV